MATMLGVVLTDASAAPETLYGLLAPIVQRTWNQLSVDGDTSTNDTVFLLASGASRRGWWQRQSGAAILGRAIEAVARSLARQQAADGEGASTLITCQVSGARRITTPGNRPLRGQQQPSQGRRARRDPNWGPRASAAGNARLPDEELLEAAGLHHTEAMPRAGRGPSSTWSGCASPSPAPSCSRPALPSPSNRADRPKSDGCPGSASFVWTSAWAKAPARRSAAT